MEHFNWTKTKIFSLLLLQTLSLSSSSLIEDPITSAESFSGRIDPFITTTIHNPRPQTEEVDMLVSQLLNSNTSRYIKMLARAFHWLVLLVQMDAALMQYVRMSFREDEFGT